MRIKIDESLKFMKNSPEIKTLLVEGIRTMPPNRRRKNRVHVTDAEDRAFRKVWSSFQGLKIRAIMEMELGAHTGVKSAARLYFSEIWREENARK